MEELAVLIFLGVEKESEVVENVVEEVVDDNSTFYWSWKSLDEFGVFADHVQSIIHPVVLEMTVYLAVEGVGEWAVFAESGHEGHPVVKFKGLLLEFWTVEGLDDLDEGAHYETEIGDAHEHEENDQNHLEIGFGDQVSITDSRKGRYGEITAGD